MLTQVGVTWATGIAIGEMIEDGRTVFIPAWANGCLDERSVADTPRFEALADAEAWVRGKWEARRAAQAAQVTAAPAPARRAPVATVIADCGHEIPRSWLMDASMGTACPDCYDRMS